MIYKQGTIPQQQLLDIAFHIPAVWKQTGRALGLEEHILQAIEIDNRYVNECAISMLRKWQQQEGSRALTYQILGDAFNHHLVCRSDLALKFCADQDAGMS